jgi:hypothetical protein
VVDVSVVPFISKAGRLVLLAAVAFPKCYSRAWVNTKEVYQEYTRLSAIADVKPVTVRQFYNILKQLEQMGVIERSAWSEGRYGRMSVLKVVEPERIWRELREDLALGEVAERICSNIPPSPPSEGAGATIGKSINIMDSTSSRGLGACLGTS